MASSSPDLKVSPLAVLDTNVVLDVLVFDDVRARQLKAALLDGHLLWLATEPMFDELADVLRRPFLSRWQNDTDAVLARARGLCRMVDAPQPAPAPRCADPDDQKFIELAWHWPTAWLLSRDHAVLALAGAARSRGLQIIQPSAWPGTAVTGAQAEKRAAEAAP